MWNYYIVAMDDLNKDLTNHRELKEDALFFAMRDACARRRLTEEQFFDFLCLLDERDAPADVTERGCQKAVEQHPKSIPLWETYVNFMMGEYKLEQVEAVFRRAIDAVGFKAITIWERFILYLRNQLEPMFHFAFLRVTDEICALTDPDARKIKEKLIHITMVTIDFERAHKVFKEIIAVDPGCYEAYDAILNLQQMNERVSI